MSKIVQLSWAVGAMLAVGGCAASPDNGGVGGAVATQTGAVPGVTTGGVFGTTGGVLNTTGGVLNTTGGVVGTTGGAIAPDPGGDVPCEVAQVLATHCSQCHGEMTNFGGPMSLVTKADFDAMGKMPTTMTTPVHELVADRINRTSGVGMMPPAGMPDADKAILNQWLNSGMPARTGTCQAATGGTVGGTGGMPMGGTTPPVDEGPGWGPEGKPQETCYQFLKHGGQTPGDTSPFNVLSGEHYANFFYKVPWTEPSVATRWRTIYDKTAVLHHWLMYESTASTAKDGNWDDLPADGVAGAHATASTLVAGWAVGGGDEEFPEGIAMRMPPPGSMLELEWHHYNTGAAVGDRSGVEICVIPESKMNPKYVADMTWLGTENLTIPGGGQEVVQGGPCTPSFAKGDEIHVVFWQPHMHTIGVHMDTWVMHPDGSEDHVFSEPFQFDRQISYRDNGTVIRKGDRLDVHCTFRNPSAQTIPFGQSTNKEMCYQFVVAYPADSLRAAAPFNGVLTGAKNGCLAFPNGPLSHSN